MSNDFDRISLDQRINKIEKTKGNIRTKFPSIDFDQYPDNSIIRNKDGLIFKYSGESISQSGSKIYVCGICSTPYGLISGRSLLMFKLDVPATFKPDSNIGNDTYIKMPDLGEDCSSVIWNAVNSGLVNGTYVGHTLFMWKVLFDRSKLFLVSLSPLGVCFQFDRSGNHTISNGVYFGRIVGGNVFLQNEASAGRAPILVTTGDVPYNRYNRASDLPAKWKPLFPASWSV